MGCDIHIVLESRRSKAGDDPAGPWIGVWCSDYFPNRRPQVAQRDYDFFAAIANVRSRQAREGLPRRYPQNLPEDISPLAWRQYMTAPTDYHSASHMTAKEFVDAYYEVNPPEDGKTEFGLYRLLCADADDYDFRVVFWFDN